MGARWTTLGGPAVMNASMAWRILVAPTCFKENLPMEQVAAAMARGVRRGLPEAHIAELPLSDGGEGFTRMLARATGGSVSRVRVRGPLGAPVQADLANLGGHAERTMALEIAGAAGLRLVPEAQRDPLAASSYGVGELLRAALDAGAEHIIVGCGDGGICDGGTGMARALGVRFVDTSGVELPDRPDALQRLHAVDVSKRDPRLERAQVEVACNLHGLLTGPDSTAKVYGPQKGADAEAVAVLDACMERLAGVIRNDLGVDVARLPGAGAAGGMGAAFHALLGAELRWRYDVIFRYIDVDAQVRESDLVLTGEGTIDARTPLGKLPCEIGRRGARHGVPVVALAGQLGQGAHLALEEGLTACFAIADGPLTPAQSMERSEELLARATEAVARLFAARRMSSPRTRGGDDER
jgi:glycerate 2-kinase